MIYRYYIRLFSIGGGCICVLPDAFLFVIGAKVVVPQLAAVEQALKDKASALIE